MMIGLDRSFKPEWVYQILKLSKPGLKYKDLEPEFNSIIEVNGLKSKKNIMTIMRRYYLKLKRTQGIEYFDNNYLHDISIKYSFDSIKPILLFVLICQSRIVKFLQEKINRRYLYARTIDRQALLTSTIQEFGDRRIVKYAVGYYLTILCHFGILSISNKKYEWKTKKVYCTSYMIRDLILLYSEYTKKMEISIQDIINEISFTYIDLDSIEDALKEFNSESWNYQKGLISNEIIIKKRFQ